MLFQYYLFVILLELQDWYDGKSDNVIPLYNLHVLWQNLNIIVKKTFTLCQSLSRKASTDALSTKLYNIILKPLDASTDVPVSMATVFKLLILNAQDIQTHVFIMSTFITAVVSIS